MTCFFLVFLFPVRKRQRLLPYSQVINVVSSKWLIQFETSVHVFYDLKIPFIAFTDTFFVYNMNDNVFFSIPAIHTNDSNI